MPGFFQDYISQLKAETENANRRRSERAEATRERLRSANGGAKPLTTQIEELVRTLPAAQLARPWVMADFVTRLHGRFHDRPAAGAVGQALRQLGWVSRRDWSAAGAGRRLWTRP